MGLPTARVLPTAVLARSGRAATDGSSPFGQLPQFDGGAFVPDPAQEAASLSPEHLYELGLTTAAMGFHTAAIEALRDCTAKAPDHSAAWSKLAELLRLSNRDQEATETEATAERAAASGITWKKGKDERDLSELDKAEQELRESLSGRPPEEATAALRDRLVANPLDAAAMRLLAQLEKLAGDEITSLCLFERALDVSPNYIGARQNYAELLVARRVPASAAAQTAQLIAQEPQNAYYRSLHAHTMFHVGKMDTAIEILTGLLRESPGEPRYWLPYAQALHYVGRRDESVQAFRHTLSLQPDMGEAYWGLADMKGDFITEGDIAAMRARLEEGDLEPLSRKFMLYALAHALERQKDFAGSFSAYTEAGRLSRSIADSEPKPGMNSSDGRERDDIDRSDHAIRVQRLKQVFSRENLETRLVQAPVSPGGCTPIFVIGLPRAGSTLTEQILASHSQVEGTRELPVMGDIARELTLSRMVAIPNAYPECVLDLAGRQLGALGARYIEGSRDFRKTDRPFFVDKRPWNWLEAGLIHLILPQAKIIDVRREPMAACFGMYKQPIEGFSHDLEGLGRYYNKYVSMMEHWRTVLPGRILFVQYERLVDDTENEIRRMLEYCGLPFEEGCLRFWETDRTVSTPSAGQVRRPIYRDSLQQWRNFEPWLGPLKDGLSQRAEA